MATVVGSIAPATQTVSAAVHQNSIIYDGEGELTKTLTTGQKASVSVSDSIINITVDGEKYGYYTTRCVGTCTIAADDLLHIFWHSGHYYVYDLRESGMFIKAYKDSSQKYCSEDTNGATEVLGTSTPNVNLHSSIIDGTYFYQYGKTGKKTLMTRAEFTNIVDPQPTEPDKPSQPDKPTEPDKPSNPDGPTVDIDSDTHVKFDGNFWWQKWENKEITWDQLLQVIWQNKWDIETDEVEEEVIYYIRNEKGEVVEEHHKKISHKTENGTGNGSATGNNTGNANVDGKEEGNGGISGTIDSSTHTDVNINKPIPIQVQIIGSTTTTTSTTASTTTDVRVEVTKPNKKGWVKIKLLFNDRCVSLIKFHRGKRIMKFNKLKFTNVENCGFIDETYNVYLLDKKNKKGKTCRLSTLPRNAKLRTQKRTIKGRYVSVQENKKRLARKATKPSANIIDLPAKDKAFNKK